jgi:hypothetical protein
MRNPLQRLYEKNIKAAPGSNGIAQPHHLIPKSFWSYNAYVFEAKKEDLRSDEGGQVCTGANS